MRWLLVVATVLGLGGTAMAAEPTFDCSKAEHEIETLICGSEALSADDQKLAEVYAEALKVAGTLADASEAEAELRATQRGWIKGRNDCWKADDKTACTAEAYDRRIAGLQAQFILVNPQPPVFYRCDDNSEIVASFLETNPPTARLERGDTTIVVWQGISGSGARYEGDFGVVFWIKGDEAMVEWPQGTEFDCHATN